MTADKMPPAEAQPENDARHRTRNSDVVPSKRGASIESTSEGDVSDDETATRETPTFGARARALSLPRRAGFIVPAQAPFRITRVFSLPRRLMQKARAASDIVVRRALARGRVRVWVPACKTGSTAYTISMLLLEASQPRGPLELMVFATDTDESALALARAGRYPAGAALGMDPRLRARYTFDEGQTIRVSEPLRERCVFSRHDVGRDPPFPRLDLIVCEQVVHAVAPSQRAELVRRLQLGLRHDGLLLAFDHPECFSPDLFEPVGDGCFRPRKQPRPIRTRLPREPSLNESIAARKQRLESARAALVPWPHERSEARDDPSEFIRTLGHPLLVCDGQLRVLVMSVEAQRLFDRHDADLTLELGELSESMPGGHEIVSAARRVVAGHEGQDVVVRTGSRTYLARARPAWRGEGVTIAFTDVTPFEAAATCASQQQDRHAAVARLRNLALRLTDPSDLYEEAYAAISHHLSGCVAAIVLERGADERELEVGASWGLGSDPMSTLSSLAGGRRLIEEAMAGDAVVSRTFPQQDVVWGSDDSTAAPWFAASASFAASRSFPPPQAAPGSRPPASRTSPSTAPEGGMASALIGGAKTLGAVLALFGHHRAHQLEDEDFLLAVAGAVGEGIARYRTQRRLELELEAISVVNRASTLPEAGRGLLQALSPFRVDELQIGEVRRAAAERWVPLYTSVSGRGAKRAVTGVLPSGRIDAMTFRRRSDGGGEAWLPVSESHGRHCLLRLRGKALRAPDPEFARGLTRVAELLRTFLVRRSVDKHERLEPSRREERAELAALYASLPVAVSLHDGKGALLRSNRELAPSPADGAARLDGGEAGAREGAVLRRLYAEEIPSWVERALATGEPLRGVELRVTDGDERRFWLCNFVPLRGADGGVQRVSTVAQDITALKRLEALRDADQRKDDFIALLAHELRNPIAAIRNATELLARFEQPTPQLRRLQGIYDRQTLQAAQLLDGLLDIARVARGKIQLQRSPLPVVELVRAAVDDRRAQFQARRLELRLPHDELWVSADRARLLQIIDNLLSNALKFTSESGRIGIEVARAAEQGEIVVEDDGAGIDPEVLSFIFEPFWQARSNADATGLGLGLALVHGLTQLHGFRITAESAGLGRGASFRLTFPLIDAPEAIAPPSQVAPRALDLMLVEDNGDVSETLAELLDLDGHRVEVASSAERALERLRARRFDVILIDIGLPGMSGLELAARLRQDPKLSSMKLVALTGFGGAPTEDRMKDVGFDRYLIKPVRFEALRHCLARVSVTRAGAER